jgi:hypothetical protein
VSFTTQSIAEESGMNPFIIDDSQERYQDRLHEAEQRRQAKLAYAKRGSRADPLGVRIGDLLIALGRYLKAAALPEPRFD